MWFDADADGVGPNGNGLPGDDNNEAGIPGVTVALIKDVNGNGIWDAGEPIIATDTTDANGDYLFPGLPDGNYLVWVNDTDNVLGDKTPTYDKNGGTAPTGSGAPTGVASSTVLGLARRRWIRRAATAAQSTTRRRTSATRRPARPRPRG